MDNQKSLVVHRIVHNVDKLNIWINYMDVVVVMVDPSKHICGYPWIISIEFCQKSLVVAVVDSYGGECG